MYADSLYRVSFKCFIQDGEGKVLVVKEKSRGSWDLPGGGLEHDESIRSSIERELKEEVAYTGGFAYSVLTIDEPVRLRSRDIWQVRVVIKVKPDTMHFDVGEEADAISFITPSELKDSCHEAERKIYSYAMLQNI